jgi:hypothetical protein
MVTITTITTQGRVVKIPLRHTQPPGIITTIATGANARFFP